MLMGDSTPNTRPKMHQSFRLDLRISLVALLFASGCMFKKDAAEEPIVPARQPLAGELLIAQLYTSGAPGAGGGAAASGRSLSSACVSQAASMLVGEPVAFTPPRDLPRRAREGDWT